MPKKSKGIVMYLAMFGLLIVLLFAMMSLDKPVSTLKYYQVLDYFKQGEVAEYQIDYNSRTLTLRLEGQGPAGGLSTGKHPAVNEDIKPYIEQYEQTNDATFKRNYLPAKEPSLLANPAADPAVAGRHGAAVDFYDASSRRRRRQDEHLRKSQTKTGGGRQEGDLCRRCPVRMKRRKSW